VAALQEEREMTDTSVQFYRLEWTDRKGGFRSEQGSFERLSKKLETIRCDAALWVIDEYGCKVEVIGRCEPAEGRPDDKRIKWQWWYDSSWKSEIRGAK